MKTRRSRCLATFVALSSLPVALALAAEPQAAGDVRTVESASGPIRVERVAGGLRHPWGLAFLPDGRLLITERAGALRILEADGRLGTPMDGVPHVARGGQGGLLDVALDPGFEQNQRVYLSFAESDPEDEGGGSTTSLGRGRLVDGQLQNFAVIFRQRPWVEGSKHFGGRIVFAPGGELFLTLGERFQFDPAQDTTNHLGAIVRLRPDGSAPPDNPFVGRGEARPEIWSYGHRNVESAAIDPATGALWVAEMGPQGGDELNFVEPGRNYGWPLVSWGEHYDGTDIPAPSTRTDLAMPVRHWTPVISPSGMVFYEGDLLPGWRGSMLIGGLSAHGIVRVLLSEGRAVVDEERIALGARIRDVEQGPDGSVYLATDHEDGEIWRLSPAARE